MAGVTSNKALAHGHKVFLGPEWKEIGIKFETQGQHTARLKIKQLERDENPRETSGIPSCLESWMPEESPEP